MAAGVRQNNAASIRLHAHALQGLCATISANRLESIARDIALANAAGGAADLEMLLGRLKSEAATLETVLSEIAASPSIDANA